MQPPTNTHGLPQQPRYGWPDTTRSIPDPRHDLKYLFLAIAIITVVVLVIIALGLGLGLGL